MGQPNEFGDLVGCHFHPIFLCMERWGAYFLVSP